MTGHTTDYFVDGVPKKEKEYKEIVNSLVDENIFKLITNPLYFNETYSWQNRRKLLLEMCGDISDEDVIASHDDLKALTDILSGHSVDDHRKVVASKKATINKELDMLPVRIDEALRGKPEVTADPEVLRINIDTLNADIEKLENDKALLQNGHSIVDKRAELKNVQRKIMARETELQIEYKKQSALKSNEYDSVVAEIHNMTSKLKDVRRRRIDANKEIDYLQNAVNELSLEFEAINKEAFTIDIDTNCPTCGQPLPEDQIKSSRDKAELNFNKQKSKRLEEINNMIGLKNNAIANIKEKLQELDAESKNTAGIDAKERRKADLINEIELLKPPVLEDDEVYSDLKAEELMLQMAIDEDNSDHSEEIAELEIKISANKTERMKLEQELNKFAEIKRIDIRVSELEAKQAELSEEKMKLDEASYLMDEFVKAKVNMLEESINARFKLARFKMFNVMLNGNVEECCETTYKGVPYRSMNNAARINVGLDIINALTSYFKVNAPVFIDNAEAVTDFIPVNSQTIKLIVDESEPQLVVKEV